MHQHEIDIVSILMTCSRLESLVQIEQWALIFSKAKSTSMLPCQGVSLNNAFQAFLMVVSRSYLDIS